MVIGQIIKNLAPPPAKKIACKLSVCPKSEKLWNFAKFRRVRPITPCKPARARSETSKNTETSCPPMTPDPSLLHSEKYRREHLPSLEDIIATRRDFLTKTGMGFGALSLSSLFGVNLNEAQAASSPGSVLPLSPKRAPLPSKARAVIHIFASGGPSQVDTWDPKPELTKYDNKSIPGHEGLAFGSPFKFTKSGKSGVEVSEVFPKLGECIDDIAVIRSLWTDIPAHEVAARMMHTGSLQLPKRF